MNPRQRGGLILIAVAVVGAVAVFTAMSRYVADVNTHIGPPTPVLRLVAPTTPYRPVDAAMVELVTIPVRWAPSTALTDRAQLNGMVAASALPAGALLQAGMLIPQPQLVEGERELAILVDAETGVAGKIGPGETVDIFATFPGSQVESPQAQVVVQHARILDVGLTQQQGSRAGFAENNVVPVTFALSVEESLQLAYIESFAEKVRLALRPSGDGTPIPDRQRLYQPLGVQTEQGSTVPAEGLAPTSTLQAGP